MLTHDEIRDAVAKVAQMYPIKTVSYFGSYANGQATEESDLDLLVEFDKPPVSLFVISGIKIAMEELLNIPVDVLHAPLPKDSFLEIEKEVRVYG